MWQLVILGAFVLVNQVSAASLADIQNTPIAPLAEDGPCECSAFMRNYSDRTLIHPPFGPLYVIKHNMTDTMFACGDTAFCKYLCLQYFRQWEADFLGWESTIPEDDDAHDPGNVNQTYGEFFCKRAQQTFVDCGGVQYPEITQHLALYWRIKDCTLPPGESGVPGCDNWVYMHSGSGEPGIDTDMKLCCDDEGEWCPSELYRKKN